MGLLQKLKSALGLDGATSSDATRSDDVDVTVEREPSTEDEDAVKGTDTSADEADAAGAASADTTEDPDADGAAVDEPDTDAAESDTDGVDETAEDTADGTDDEADADASDDVADADEADEADEAPEGSTDPVTELNGIGPAYADRLAGQGIDTVGELAVADPEAIAAETDLGAKRVSDWIDQAREY